MFGGAKIFEHFSMCKTPFSNSLVGSKFNIAQQHQQNEDNSGKDQNMTCTDDFARSAKNFDDFL
ncbi:MAG: hypothetical protein GY820_32385 [Gammaproteobacteria bacterium]|nr:hypothetical protein [Gammaproteobacteria bacterium]